MQIPNINTFTIFREEATSALAGFHAGPLAWSNWNLEMLVFAEGGKPENPEKNSRSKARTNNKLNPHMAPGRNRTRATLVGIMLFKLIVKVPVVGNTADTPNAPRLLPF